LALVFSAFIEASHFNGGTLCWESVNANDISSLTTIGLNRLGISLSFFSFQNF